MNKKATCVRCGASRDKRLMHRSVLSGVWFCVDAGECEKRASGKRPPLREIAP